MSKNSINNTLKSSLPSSDKKKSKKLTLSKCNELNTVFADTKDKTLFKLGQGTYGLTFRGCYNSVCSIKQGIKLSSVSTRYPDKKDEPNKNHPTNLEIVVGKKLSEFVVKKYTPNINMIINNSRCNLEDLKNIKGIKRSEWLKENKELLSEGKIYPFVNVYFMELGTIDLKKFVKTRCEQGTIGFEEMLEILFQIFHTLSVIQYKIPEFRHNDLKPNNLIVKVNSNNMKRDFNNYTLVNNYLNGSKSFYIPHRGYTVKIIDFDFSNAKNYKNLKLKNYKNTNFRYLGYSPECNPTFDVHFILNFFYASKDIMSSIPQFKELIKKILPKDCIGTQNKYVEQNKLTAYYVNKETNYIPPKLLTPTELIHFTKYFDKYTEKDDEKKIKETYTSPFKHVTYDLRKRKDMFNVFLRKERRETLV